MKKIRIHPDMTKEIAEELKTSTTTVYAALSYYNNSPLGEKIRELAKDKLLKESQKIIDNSNSN